VDLRLSALNLAQYPPARLIELAQPQEACGYETFFAHEVMPRVRAQGEEGMPGTAAIRL
jgi:hypothetical protein